MKSILIFFFYFISIVSIAGLATFLMYHNINGWGWLIVIDVLITISNVRVKE